MTVRPSVRASFKAERMAARRRLIVAGVRPASIICAR